MLGFVLRASVLTLGVLASTACGEDTHDAGPLNEVDGGTPVCASCGSCDQAFRVTEQTHVAGTINYPDFPPPGGPHNPCWLKWGVYEEPIQTERWVHNLEHGGVVFLYEPGEEGDAFAAELAAFAADHPRVIVAPSPELTTQFAAVAWGHRLLAECFDLDAAERFYQARFGKGPEDIGNDPPSECL